MQSQEIIHIAGGPAYSKFRKEKLLGKLQAINHQIKDIHSEYVHIIWCEKKITETDKATLEKILHYGPKAHTLKFKHNAIITMPRPGPYRPGLQELLILQIIVDFMTSSVSRELLLFILN